MFTYKFGTDPNIFQLKAGKCCHIGIGSGIKAGNDDIDYLDLPVLPRSCFKEFLFSRLDSTRGELALYDGYAFLNFLGVSTCTVAS